MNYEYDKDKIKNELTVEQIEDVLMDFDAEPEMRGEIIVSKTVCHCGQSHKLYYYPNTTLFKCYTDCGETFDIFELTRKVMSREHPKPREDSAWNLPEAIDYIARRFGYSPVQSKEDDLDIKDDLSLFDRYDRINNININTQEVELKEYDGKFLNNLPHPRIAVWEAEGITPEVIKAAEICFDPKNCGIVIPHRDINNRLIGIRERALALENEERYGKYRPALIGGTMFNHPLGFNLYNLNHSKNNIVKMKKAFVFEGEKSCLLYRSYFGEENDISAANCGSSFVAYQAWLLINIGTEEIIIAYDKQYQNIGDDEFKKLVKNLKNIHTKYGKYVKISIMFDKGNLLKYKDSPIDEGPDTFLKLYKERIDLYKEVA